MAHEASVAYARIVATTGNVPAALAEYNRLMTTADSMAHGR